MSYTNEEMIELCIDYAQAKYGECRGIADVDPSMCAITDNDNQQYVTLRAEGDNYPVVVGRFAMSEVNKRIAFRPLELTELVVDLDARLDVLTLAPGTAVGD